MLKVRLQRVGRKHEPIFRLVLTDSKNGPKSGKFIEILGHFDSRRGEEAKFNEERVKHWISKGAKTSETVHNLLISKNIIEGKKINVLPKKRPIKKEGEQPAQGQAEPQNASPEAGNVSGTEEKPTDDSAVKPAPEVAEIKQDQDGEVKAEESSTAE